MKLQLKSDFRDWYDHMFDLKGIVFERPSIKESRREGLIELIKMGLQTPDWGELHDLKGDLRCSYLVIYDDEYAHRGEGKRIVDVATAMNEMPPETLAMVFIPHFYNNTSLRYLRVGVEPPRWLAYTSPDNSEWRSNYGNDIEIEVLTSAPEAFRKFHDPNDVPMLAVDFILTQNKLWAAIDYNTSPGLEPLKGVWGADKIVDSLKCWYMNREDYKQ